MDQVVKRACIASLITVLLTATAVQWKNVSRQIRHYKINSISTTAQFPNRIHHERYGSHLSMQEMILLSVDDFSLFCDLVMLLLDTTPCSLGGDVTDRERDALVDVLTCVKQHWHLAKDAWAMDTNNMNSMTKWWLSARGETIGEMGALWRKRGMQQRHCEFSLGCLIYTIKLEHEMSTGEEDIDYLMLHLENGVSEREHPAVKYLWQLQFDVITMTNPKSQFTDVDDLKHVFSKLNRFVKEIHDEYKGTSTSGQTENNVPNSGSMEMDVTLIKFRGLTRQEVTNYGLVFIVEQLLFTFFVLGSNMQYKRPAELHYFADFLLQTCPFIGQRMHAFLICVKAETMHHDLNSAIVLVDQIIQRYPGYQRALLLKIDILSDLKKFSPSESSVILSPNKNQHQLSYATMNANELENELWSTIKKATRAHVSHTQLTNTMITVYSERHAHEPSVLLDKLEDYFLRTHPQPPLTEIHFVKYLKKQCQLSGNGDISFVQVHYMPLLEKFRKDITVEHRFAKTPLHSKLLYYFTEKSKLLFCMGKFEQCEQILGNLLQFASSKDTRFSERDVSSIELKDGWIADLIRLCRSCHTTLCKDEPTIKSIVENHQSSHSIPLIDMETNILPNFPSLKQGEPWEEFLDIIWTLFAPWGDDPFMLAFDIRRFKTLIQERAKQLPNASVARNAHGLILLYRYFKKSSGSHNLMLAEGEEVQQPVVDMEEKEVKRVEKMQRILVDLELGEAIKLLESGSLKIKISQSSPPPPSLSTRDENVHHGEDNEVIVADLMQEMQREFEMDLDMDDDDDDDDF